MKAKRLTTSHVVAEEGHCLGSHLRRPEVGWDRGISTGFLSQLADFNLAKRATMGGDWHES
jgi:hypothetical protein